MKKLQINKINVAKLNDLSQFKGGNNGDPGNGTIDVILGKDKCLKTSEIIVKDQVDL